MARPVPPDSLREKIAGLFKAGQNDGNFSINTFRSPDSGAMRSLRREACIDINTASIYGFTEIVHIVEARAKRILEGRH